MYQRLKRQGHQRTPPPSIILANVLALCNEIDELQANIKFILEYRNACLIALTEMWLKEQDLQTHLEMDDFGIALPVDKRLNCDLEIIWRRTVFLHQQYWYNTVVHRESLWTPEI